MENYTFIIFLLLSLALVLTVIKRGKYARYAKALRWTVILGASVFFTLWFVKRSKYPLVMNAMSVQIINKLPQPLDFYVVKVRDSSAAGEKYELKHAGKIRPEHYQLEYLTMGNSNEFWIAGYLGRKNMVYFSQHAVPQKENDQIIEVHNYINQSIRLAETAGNLIDRKKLENVDSSILVTLSLLLLFLHTVLLMRRN